MTRSDPPAPSLPERFRTFLRSHPDLLPRGSTILVAWSGGPDSTALLRLLLAESGRAGWCLRAAHFDHGVRAESAREAQEVLRRAAEWGVDCFVGRPPEPLPCRQEALREARYAFLSQTADGVGADRIAVGHQADDQAETVLFRILRGTGLRGLGGMPLRRGRLVRPLLPFRRAEIEAYLAAHGVDALEDPSNADLRWARTRIRHELLPALEEIAGAPLAPRLLALAAAARRADRVLDRQARQALRGARFQGGRVCVARDALLAYDPELRARAVRLLARRLGIRLRRGGTHAAVEFIKRGRSGGGVDLAAGVRLWREFDLLWFGAPPRCEPVDPIRIDRPGEGSGRLTVGDRAYRIAWGVRDGHGAACEQEVPQSGRWLVEFPLSELRFPVQLRGPRSGDRLRIRGGSRKLKKIFQERRVPLSERARTPVLEAAGEVLWVANVGTAEPLEASPEEERFFVGISVV